MERTERHYRILHDAHMHDNYLETRRAFLDAAAQLQPLQPAGLDELLAHEQRVHQALEHSAFTSDDALQESFADLSVLEREVASEPSKLNEEIVGAIEKLSHEFWPDAAVIPVMSTGATDGAFLRNAGIPTYGHSGMAMEPGDAGRIHGRDERVPMKSFYNGGEYLYRLVKMLAGGT